VHIVFPPRRRFYNNRIIIGGMGRPPRESLHQCHHQIIPSLNRALKRQTASRSNARQQNHQNQQQQQQQQQKTYFTTLNRLNRIDTKTYENKIYLYEFISGM